MIAREPSDNIQSGQRRYAQRSWRCVGTWRSLVAHSAGGRVVAGSNPAVPTSGSGRTLHAKFTERPKILDTLYLLLGIIGFMVLIAVFFFGGFLILDFIWGRRGGDL